jgi:hypothetical protein
VRGDPATYDDNDEFLEDLDQIAWNRLSVSFSHFIFDALCIGRLHATRNRTWVEATAPAPGAAELDALGRCCDRDP